VFVNGSNSLNCATLISVTNFFVSLLFLYILYSFIVNEFVIILYTAHESNSRFWTFLGRRRYISFTVFRSFFHSRFRIKRTSRFAGRTLFDTSPNNSKSSYSNATVKLRGSDRFYLIRRRFRFDIDGIRITNRTSERLREILRAFY